MLTDRELKGLKPRTKDYYTADRGGLYVRTFPSGRKQFAVRSRAGGKTRWYVLGDYPELPLSEARKKAADYLDGLTNVVMPVDKVFSAFYKHITTQLKKPEYVLEKYERDVKPVLGAKSIAEVTRADVSALLQGIVDRGSPVMANRVLADIKHMFDFAVSKGWMEENVLAPLTRKVVGGREKSRDKTLSQDELISLIRELRNTRFDYRTRTALGLALITGQRVSEVLAINSSDICDNWWTIPKELSKNGKGHKVYLSPQARALLKVSPPPYVKDHRVLSKALRRAGVGYTPHDLRRTVATMMADLGVMPHVIEKILNHQMEGVMAVYNRAEYLPERKDALRLWGRYLAKTRRESSCVQGGTGG